MQSAQALTLMIFGQFLFLVFVMTVSMWIKMKLSSTSSSWLSDKPYDPAAYSGSMILQKTSSKSPFGAIK